MTISFSFHNSWLLIAIISQGILDRYKQIRPKFVFSETEVVYAGKTVDILPKITQVAKELLSVGLQQVILLPSTKTGKTLSNHQVPNRYFHKLLIVSFTENKTNLRLSARLCRPSSLPETVGLLLLSNCHLAIRFIFCTRRVLVVHQSASSIVQGLVYEPLTFGFDKNLIFSARVSC